MNMQTYNLREFLERYLQESLDDLPLFQFIGLITPIVCLDFEQGPWLAGGAVRRTLNNEALDSDFDLFFKTDIQYRATKEALLKAGATLKHSTSNADTLDLTLGGKTYEIQLITMDYYQSAETVLDSFDYTITQCLTDGNTLMVGQYTLWDLAKKRLALHRLTFGVATVRRIIKYTQQGYTACAGTIGDILDEAASNPEVIRRETGYVD